MEDGGVAFESVSSYPDGFMVNSIYSLHKNTRDCTYTLLFPGIASICSIEDNATGLVALCYPSSIAVNSTYSRKANIGYFSNRALSFPGVATICSIEYGSISITRVSYYPASSIMNL